MAEKIIVPGEVSHIHIANKKNAGKQMKFDNRNKSGRRTFTQTGADGAIQQVNPNGSAVIIGAGGSRSTIPSPQKVESQTRL